MGNLCTKGIRNEDNEDVSLFSSVATRLWRGLAWHPRPVVDQWHAWIELRCGCALSVFGMMETVSERQMASQIGSVSRCQQQISFQILYPLQAPWVTRSPCALRRLVAHTWGAPQRMIGHRLVWSMQRHFCVVWRGRFAAPAFFQHGFVSLLNNYRHCDRFVVDPVATPQLGFWDFSNQPSQPSWLSWLNDVDAVISILKSCDADLRVLVFALWCCLLLPAPSLSSSGATLHKLKRRHLTWPVLHQWCSEPRWDTSTPNQTPTFDGRKFVNKATNAGHCMMKIRPARC